MRSVDLRTLRPVYVAGFGQWTPDTWRFNDAWPPEFANRGDAQARVFNDIPNDDGDLAGRLSERHIAAEANDPFLGATQRPVALDSTLSREVEAKAAADALANTGIRPGEVDVIISSASIRDRLTPSGANYVAHALGIDHVTTWELDAACASAVLQLRSAVGLVVSGQANVVLLTQSHLMLKVMPLMHPAAPGLGDMASAMVITSRPGPYRLRRLHSQTHGEYHDAVTYVRHDNDERDRPWHKEGPAFRLGSLDIPAAKRLMKDTVKTGFDTMTEICAQDGISPSELGVFCSVQPRGWIPEAIGECMGLEREQIVHTFADYAHLGGCGPVVNWKRAHDDGRLDTGAVLGLYAQGAGFTRAAALVDTM